MRVKGTMFLTNFQTIFGVKINEKDYERKKTKKCTNSLLKIKFEN